PVWDWSFETDGALALDRHEAWDVPRKPPRNPVSQADTSQGDLNPPPSFATVPRMPQRRTRRETVRMRQKRARARRIRRIVALTLLVAAVLVTLFLTAFGTGQQERVSAPLGPAHAATVAPAPPRPEVVAMRGSLPLQLPVQQERLTAIGYHASGDNALALEPLGRKANEGFLSRVFHRIFGGGGGNVRYYQLPGASGPSTTSLDVGAPARTDVYSPVDGPIVGLNPHILNGTPYGAQNSNQPAQA